MKKEFFLKLLPHFIAVAVFLIVAVVYCRPALEGKVVQQSDVIQWKAMAKNSFDYKEKHGKFPLWTNGMFSGMPAYQIALEPENRVSPNLFYFLLTLGLPKPISYFFLACICFYFLSQVLNVNPYLGIIGGLAYAYVTYNPIIVAVGHDTKMQSIALLPAFIGGLLVIYDKKYLLGAALFTLFTSLLVSFNHMQIVYYSLLIAFFLSIGYLVHWLRQKNYRHLVIAFAVAACAGALGVLCNSVNILVTNDAAKTTIRGGTELPGQNSTKSGLSTDYALSYSLYKSEPFVMMVPKMYGGSDLMEVPEENSKAVQQLQQMPPQVGQSLQYALHFYWGGIGGTQGPPYIGAIICFLAILGFFILDNKHKWWILGASILAILMSWGEYFSGFNVFLLQHLPYYNKFRAPSMILVIPTFLLCMMAVLTLQRLLEVPDRAELWEKYKKGLIATGAIFIILLLVYFNSSFTSENDKQYIQNFSRYGNDVMNYVHQFFDALKEDRKDLFMGSLFRSFLYIAFAAIVLWLFIKKNLNVVATFTLIGLAAFIDVMTIDSKYLNSENYQDTDDYNNNFRPTAADVKIDRDTAFYRVFDLRNGVKGSFNGGALAAYFHKLIGGYHPAKLSIYQDLIEHQFYRDNIEQQLFTNPSSVPVVNMLNTKYIIFPLQQGDSAVLNPGCLGAAWLVKGIRSEATAAGVMNSLTNLNPADTAVIFSKDVAEVSNGAPATNDTVYLVNNDNDEVLYKSKTSTNRFAVFSEIFYDRGWRAFIDDKEAPIIRTNYVLRGLSVPAGDHNIRFSFHPASYYTGEKISFVAGLLFYLLLIVAVLQVYRTRKDEPIKKYT